jgi:hypothetical protein
MFTSIKGDQHEQHDDPAIELARGQVDRSILPSSTSLWRF